jgi:hypothetical protein
MMRLEDTFFVECQNCVGEGVSDGCGFGGIVCGVCDGAGFIEVESPQLEMDERDDEDDRWELADTPDGGRLSTSIPLSERCLIHAGKMDGEGWYVTSNVLWLASERIKELEARDVLAR